MYLANTSGTIGYCAVQRSKGRIICIDNELNEGMVVNRSYVLAHSANLNLRKPFWPQASDLFASQFGDTTQTDSQQNSQFLMMSLMELGMHDFVMVHRL